MKSQNTRGKTDPLFEPQKRPNKCREREFVSDNYTCIFIHMIRIFLSFLPKLRIQKKNRLKIRSYRRYGENGEKMLFLKRAMAKNGSSRSFLGQKRVGRIMKAANNQFGLT